MLLTELSRRKQKALAREIKKYIEQENRLIKGTELRQFLNKYDVTTSLKEITTLLKGLYVEKTVKKLVDSIQLPVVWDTSLVLLEAQKIYELFYNTTQTNIFISPVMNELEKKIFEIKINNIRKFKYLYYSILTDTNSEHSTIIDYQSDDNYTDNQILQFAQENMYCIYTCDYTMGLRAKSRQIDTIIFSKTNAANIPKYTPVADGKNIMLTSEIVKNLNVEEVIRIASLLKTNKFILTFEFVEMLERKKDNILIREYIAFFVFDKNEEYTIFALREDGSDYNVICAKYNALVLTHKSSTAINLKKKNIPYFFILNQSELALMKKINKELGEESPNPLLANLLQANSLEKDYENDETSQTNIISNEIVSPVLSKIPNYNPFSNTIKFNPLQTTSERMWVLNSEEKEVTPTSNYFPTLNYTALPGYYVIHGKKNFDGTFSLTVYQIIEENDFKTGQILYQSSFTEETDIPKKYRHYAIVLKRSA